MFIKNDVSGAVMYVKNLVPGTGWSPALEGDYIDHVVGLLPSIGMAIHQRDVLSPGGFQQLIDRLTL